MNVFSAFVEKPKDIRFATQEKGEKIIFVLRKHIVTNIPWLFTGILGLIAPIFLMQFLLNNPELNIVLPITLQNALVVTWYLITLIYLIESFITWYFNVYIVTDRRVIDVDFKPLFTKKISETPYQNIEDTSFTMNSFFQTVFNYGHVFVQTAAESREFEFIDVPNPSRVQDVLSDFVAQKVEKPN